MILEEVKFHTWSCAEFIKRILAKETKRKDFIKELILF